MLLCPNCKHNLSAYDLIVEDGMSYYVCSKCKTNLRVVPFKPDAKSVLEIEDMDKLPSAKA